MDELADPERVLRLAGADFLRVNPNTGAAPIFRTRRDAEITTQIYRAPPGAGGSLIEATEQPKRSGRCATRRCST